ncbi:MAG: hypothetical protein ACI9GK_002189 [Devosia sp.]|jgi:hypothetical protein
MGWKVQAQYLLGVELYVNNALRRGYQGGYRWGYLVIQYRQSLSILQGLFGSSVPATRSNISCAEFPKSLKMLSFPCDSRVNGYLTAKIVLQNGQKICHVVYQERFARWTGEAAE